MPREIADGAEPEALLSVNDFEPTRMTPSAAVAGTANGSAAIRASAAVREGRIVSFPGPGAPPASAR